MSLVLETERLNLRHFTLADAPFVLDLLNQPAFLRFIGDRGVRTLAHAEAYLERGPLRSYRQAGFGFYAVELKADGALAGMCGLIKRETLPEVDIGYAFLPQFWGRGYALEAAAGVRQYAHQTLKLARLLAIVAPDNARSIQVLEKIGLRFERILIWPEDGTPLKVYTSAD